MVQSTLYGLVQSVKTFIRQGHSVQVAGFGTFIPSFNAKSSLVEEEVNVSSIRKVKLRFIPSAELKQLLDKMEFEFDVVESTHDSKTSSGGGEEERPGEL